MRAFVANAMLGTGIIVVGVLWMAAPEARVRPWGGLAIVAGAGLLAHALVGGRWATNTVDVPRGTDARDVDAQVNRIARAGWTLVAVETLPDGSRFHFRRRR